MSFLLLACCMAYAVTGTQGDLLLLTKCQRKLLTNKMSFLADFCQLLVGSGELSTIYYHNCLIHKK